MVLKTPFDSMDCEGFLEKRVLKVGLPSPDPCGSVGWASSRKAKGHELGFQSVHMPGLWVCPGCGSV